ncbi:MAG: hypothetical protein AAF403_00495, partial [Pseudomonadota bacterium]
QTTSKIQQQTRILQNAATEATDGNQNQLPEEAFVIEGETTQQLLQRLLRASPGLVERLREQQADNPDLALVLNNAALSESGVLNIRPGTIIDAEFLPGNINGFAVNIETLFFDGSLLQISFADGQNISFEIDDIEAFNELPAVLILGDGQLIFIDELISELVDQGDVVDFAWQDLYPDGLSEQALASDNNDDVSGDEGAEPDADIANGALQAPSQGLGQIDSPDLTDVSGIGAGSAIGQQTRQNAQTAPSPIDSPLETPQIEQPQSQSGDLYQQLLSLVNKRAGTAFVDPDLDLLNNASNLGDFPAVPATSQEEDVRFAENLARILQNAQRPLIDAEEGSASDATSANANQPSSEQNFIRSPLSGDISTILSLADSANNPVLDLPSLSGSERDLAIVDIPAPPERFDPFSGVTSIDQASSSDDAATDFSLRLGALTPAIDPLQNTKSTHDVIITRFSGDGGQDTILGRSPDQTIFGDYGVSATENGGDARITQGTASLSVVSLPLIVTGTAPAGSLNRLIFSGLQSEHVVELQGSDGRVTAGSNLGGGRWSLPLDASTLSRLSGLTIRNIASDSPDFTLSVTSVINNVETQNLQSVVRAQPLVGEDDRISGGDGNDVIYGEEGNDVLSGDRGSDRLYGGSGDDVLFSRRDGDGDISQSQDLLVGGEGIDRAIIGIDLADLSPTNGRVRQDIVDLQALSQELRSGSVNNQALLSRRNSDGQFVFENLGVTLGSIERIDIKGPVYVQAQRGGQAGAPIFPLSLFSSLQQVDRAVSQIVIGGVPSGVTLSGGSRGSDGRYQITPDALSGLRLNTGLPQPDFTLQVTAISQDGTASTSGVDLPVVISATLPPSIDVSVATGVEDGNLALSVSVGLLDSDDQLSHVEFIFPTGTSLNAGFLGTNNRWTLSPQQLTQFSNVLRITPPAHFGGDFKISALAAAFDTQNSAFSRVDVTSFVKPVIDQPELRVNNLSIREEQIVPINLSASLVDSDGSETLVVYVSSAPQGTSLSNGTLSNGIWTLTSGQVRGLLLTPAIHQNQDFTLQVTALSSEDGGFGSSITVSDLKVGISGVADTADFSARAINIREDIGHTVDISSFLRDTDGSETLVLYFNNVPTGASLSAGVLSNRVWTVTQNDLSNLKITSIPHSEQDFTVSVTAMTSENDSASTALISSSFVVLVDPVADSVKLETLTASAIEDRVTLLDISTSFIDTDGSETILIRIGGVPNGQALSAGVFENRFWTLTQAQLSGLKFTHPTVHSDQNFTFQVFVHTSEDGNLSQAVTSSTLVIDVHGVADTARIQGFSASGLEDQGTVLNISTALSDTDGSETISVWISNVPTGASLSAGSLSGGVWKLAHHQLQNLTLTPVAHSNEDFTLTLTVLSSDRDNSITTAVTNSLVVNITGIADSLSLATPSASGSDTIPFNLKISPIFVDTDGSETVNVFISNTPTGSSFSEGRVSNGVWTIPGSRLASALFMPPIPYENKFTISITAVSSENDSGSTNLITSTQIVNVVPGASPAHLQTISASALEDNVAALFISASLSTSDAFESLIVYINNVPSQVKLSAGTLVSGIWTLKEEELSGLTLTPFTHSNLDFTLQVTAHVTDSLAEATALTIRSLAVDFKGQVDTFRLGALNASTSEDQSQLLQISTSFTDTDGSETLLVYLNNIATGASLSAGTLQANQWTILRHQLQGLRLTPRAHSNDDYTISVSAVVSENDGDSKVQTTSIVFETKALSDTARLQTIKASSVEDGGAINLNISTSLIDSDTSETLVVYISGVPVGTSLLAGRLSNNIWTLQPSQLANLQLTATTDLSHHFTLQVTALSSEDNDLSSVFITKTLEVRITGRSDTAALETSSVSTLEDVIVPINISSSVVDTDGSETLVVYLNNIPAGTSLSAGTVQNNIWTLIASQLPNLRLTPSLHSDEDYTISVTALTSEDDGMHSTFVTSNVFVNIRAVADTAHFDVKRASGFEDRLVDLHISSSFRDTDGSETLVVYISDVPTGVSLSAGTLSNNIWTLQQSQLANLKLTPLIHLDRDFTLKVTSLTSEDDGTSSVFVTSSLSVNISGITDTAKLKTSNARGFEEQIIDIDISTSIIDTDGSETLIVYLNNIPTGTSLSAGVLGNNVWTLQQAQLSGLKLTPIAHSDRDFTFSVTALTSEDDGTHSIITTSNVAVTITSVVDSVPLQVANISTLEDVVATLNISTSLIDTDTSETLNVYIRNIPAGASLSQGVLQNNIWTLRPSQLSNLQITFVQHSDQDFTLSVTAIASESDGSGSAITTDNIIVNVRAVADTARLVALNVFGKEDTVIATNISTSLKDTDGSETLIVYINNVPNGASLTSGTLVSGIWTLTSAQVQNLKITLVEHSDQDFTLSLTALTSEDNGTHSVFVTSNFVVTIDAVADTARLQTVDASTLEDKTFTLKISTSIVDSDTSETLVIYLSGAPQGTSLSAGILSNNIWTLQQNQLVSLIVTPVGHSDQDFTFSVTALTSEDDGTSSVFTQSSLRVKIGAIRDTAHLATKPSSTLEERNVIINISSTLRDTDGSETLVVYINNVPTGASLSGGRLNNHIWTLTQPQLAGLRFTPATHSDEDFT